MQVLKRIWLINKRTEKGLSQKQLAEVCDTTQMTISNIENGTRRPSPELAQKLAKKLNFEWIIFYETTVKN